MIFSLRGKYEDKKEFEHISKDVTWLKILLSEIRRFGGDGFIYRGVA